MIEAAQTAQRFLDGRRREELEADTMLRFKGVHSAVRPSARAAYATAAPWLPPDAAITPAGGRSPAARAVTMRLNAPRGLKLPACCTSSSFKMTGNPRPNSPEPAANGVCRPMAQSGPRRGDFMAKQHHGTATLTRCRGTDKSMGRYRDGRSRASRHRELGLPLRAGTPCMVRAMQIHASCAARETVGVLLTGPAGCGKKSDLLLRLLDRGFVLVADDRVDIEDGIASPPATLACLLQVRGPGHHALAGPAARPVGARGRAGCGRGWACRLPPATRCSACPSIALDTLHRQRRPAGRPGAGLCQQYVTAPQA